MNANNNPRGYEFEYRASALEKVWKMHVALSLLKLMACKNDKQENNFNESQQYHIRRFYENYSGRSKKK